ncbi:MAG: ABC transporter permease [Methanosarcinales archaeon]
MDLLETLRMSFESIKSAKLRSSLTTLGVVIGVAAVIANVSIGAGFSAFFTDQILSIGSNFIFVTEKMPNVLRDHELEIIENTPGVIGASPISGANAKVKYMFDTKTIDVWGLSKEYEKVGNIKMAEGSFLSDNDKYAAVIGYDVANTKFNRNISLRNPIEITFTLRDGTKVTKRFKVKGIIENQEFKLGGPGNSPSPNDRIFIPIDTLLDILGDKDYNTIFASAESMNNIKEVSEEIDKRLARNIGIPKKDLKDKDAKPYSIHTQEEFLKIMEQSSCTNLFNSWFNWNYEHHAGHCHRENS